MIIHFKLKNKNYLYKIFNINKYNLNMGIIPFVFDKSNFEKYFQI